MIVPTGEMAITAGHTSSHTHHGTEDEHAADADAFGVVEHSEDLGWRGIA